jgi:hypothetical protein
MTGQMFQGNTGLIKFCACLAAERWQSGRLRQTRNLLYPRGYRGFESLSLRQLLDRGMPLGGGSQCQSVAPAVLSSAF